MSKKAHVVGLLSNKDDSLSMSHIKNFEFDPEEAVYSTGWTIMANPSDGHQKGNATLSIKQNDNGNYDLNLVGSFVNKRKFDGDHFVAMAGIFDLSGNRMSTLKVVRGLNGTWEGLRFKTQRGGASATESVPGLDGVGLVVLNLGYKDEVDDAKFWVKALEIAKKVWDAYQAQNEKTSN